MLGIAIHDRKCNHGKIIRQKVTLLLPLHLVIILQLSQFCRDDTYVFYLSTILISAEVASYTCTCRYLYKIS